MRGSLYQCELPRIMDFFQILVLALYITQVFTKSKSRHKKHKSSSSDEDSIENLLYYKDCQKQPKTTTSASTLMPVKLRYEEPPPPPRQPDCPFPKMCCALTCGNGCGNNEPPYGRQMEPTKQIQPIQTLQNQALRVGPPMGPGMGAMQSPMIARRKKKLKFPQNMLPLPSRRDLSGLTKDKIKGLIAKDDDIRKILKDLVRVTIQKVDLLEMAKGQTKMLDGVTEVVTADDYDE